VEEGGALLRRVIDNAGRSKPISMASPLPPQLRDLGDLLVDIHGQHAHQSLMKTEAQRGLLDGQAGADAQVRAVSAAYKAWRALAKQVEE
jgi:DNA repair protein RecN (Recombination protein N)